MLLVFGSINLDIVICVNKVPSRGETVLGGDAALQPGGKGANQAHAAQLFGTQTRLVGAVGADAFGGHALQHLQRAGVDITGVRTLEGVPSGLACISVAANGENAITVAPGVNSRVSASWVDDLALKECAGVLLQGEVPLSESIALAERCRAQSRTTFMNLAPMPDAPLIPGLFDWLILNATEMSQLCARHAVNHPDLLTGARLLAETQQCSLLMTRGAEGALVMHADGRTCVCPALSGARVDADIGGVVDTTGAGDTMAGVFAAALSDGASEEQALRFAIVASGLACRRRGTQAAQPPRTLIDRTMATYYPL